MPAQGKQSANIPKRRAMSRGDAEAGAPARRRLPLRDKDDECHQKNRAGTTRLATLAGRGRCRNQKNRAGTTLLRCPYYISSRFKELAFNISLSVGGHELRSPWTMLIFKVAIYQQRFRIVIPALMRKSLHNTPRPKATDHGVSGSC